MKYINGLNTLRALAVWFVVIQHFGIWFDDTTPSGEFIKNIVIPGGAFSVYLFFVLSGFLITSILLKAKNDNNGNRLTVIKNFFVRRGLRIFPVYYLLLFLLLLINYKDIRHYFPYFATYTTNILLYCTNEWNGFSHTWTLSIEEQFYLLWPWLIIFVNNKYIKHVLLGAIAVGIISTYITLQHHMGPFLVSDCFDAFGIGGLYAWARLSDNRCKRFESTIKILIIPALLLYYYWALSNTYHFLSYGQAMFKTVSSIISMWIIIWTVNNKSVLLKRYFFENRLLNYIGKISYGIYLYHYPYIGYLYPKLETLFNRISNANPTLGVFFHDRHYTYWVHMLIIILIAAISFQFIETPILNLKNRFKYNSKKAQPSVQTS